MGRKRKIRILLREGLLKFGLTIGIVSHIEGDVYTVSYCESTEEPIAEGTQFELLDTYCADVVRTGRTRFYKDVANITEMLQHPCYLNTQLRAYIGTPLFVNGKKWGTLNYSSIYPRKQEYSDEDIEFLENQARKVVELLSS